MTTQGDPPGGSKQRVVGPAITVPVEPGSSATIRPDMLAPDPFPDRVSSIPVNYLTNHDNSGLRTRHDEPAKITCGSVPPKPEETRRHADTPTCGRKRDQASEL